MNSSGIFATYKGIKIKSMLFPIASAILATDSARIARLYPIELSFSDNFKSIYSFPSSSFV